MCALNISWLGNPSIPGGTSLSLLKPLLDALQGAHAGVAPVSPVAAALDRAGAALLDGGVQAAADNGTALRGDWAALTAALGDKLPAALRPLGGTLGRLIATTVAPANAPGLIGFPLVAGQQDAAGAPMVGGLRFQSAASLSGQSVAQVQADDDAPAWAAKLNYVLPPGDCFFRIGVSGVVDGAASAQAKPAWGGVGVAGKAQAAAHLDYYFNYDEDWLVARALARSLDVLPAPGDLARMVDACAHTQFRLASLDVLGSVSVQGDLTFGKSLVGTIAAAGATPAWSPVPLGGPITAGAALAAKFTAQWSLSGDYHLTVRNAPGGPIALLERTINSSSGAAIDLTATIGVDGVTAALDPLMTRIFPTATPLIARLGALGDVGGLARDSLIGALGLHGGDWEALAQALCDVASGGGATASAALTKAVKDRVTAYAHNYLAAGTVHAQQVAADLAAAIAAELQNVPHAGALDEALQGAFGHLQTAIKNAVGDLSGRLDLLAAAEAAKVSQALGVATADFAAFVKKLQDQVDVARAPLASWLQSYEGARAKLANAVGQLQSRKLGFEVAASYRRDEGRATLLEVQFGAAGPGAQALYGALWSGRLEDRARLQAAAVAEGGVKVVQDALTDTLQRASQFGFSLNLFDLLSVQATSTAMDKLVLRAVGADKILAVSDTITVTDTVLVNGAAGAMSLAIQLEMLALDGVAPPLSAEFKAAGDKLKPEQVQTFFRLLEATGTVSHGTGGHVKDFLFAGTGGAEAHVAQARISGACVIDRAGWETLLAVAPADLAARVQESCFVALEASVANKSEHQYLGVGPRQWLAQWLGYTGWDESEFWSRARAHVSRTDFSTDVLNAVQDGETPIAAPSPLQPIGPRGSIHLLWEIAKITAGCRDAWTAVAAEAALLRDLAALPKADPEATYNTLAALSKTIKEGMAKAFQYDLPDPAQPIKVSWRFLGLMMAVSKAAMPQQQPMFVVNVDTVEQGAPVAKLFI